MLDRRALEGEAIVYFRSLPRQTKFLLEKSNMTFRSLQDIKDYEARMTAGLDDVLYQRLPEPAIPSNEVLDPLDAE